MIARLRTATRLLIATAAVSVAAVTVATIGIGPSAGAPSPGAPPGQVICRTLTGNGPGAIFGSCDHKGATGGSATFNFNKFGRAAFGSPSGGDVTFHWASGKITRTHVAGQETGIGACPPGGEGHDSWTVTGRILEDTTGRITAPLNMEFCGPVGGWTLQPLSSAQF
jgi:hypothetical protein